MSVLLIEEVGPATSVQDFGRYGALRYGLGTTGAMDRVGLACANALVGQAWHAPVIELGPLPIKIKAKEGTIRLAVSGAMRGISLRGQAIAMNESFCLAEGESVMMRAARGGVFSYLAIEGGMAGAPTFGSFSVHRRAGLGSPFARPLEAGDQLVVGDATMQEGEHRLPVPPAVTGPIRCVLGPQDDFFSPETIARFQETEWTISATSDRMGYRLEGPPLAHARTANIVSDGIANGTIQIPGTGQPLLLLAERGTTGGYPKIATVITADLGRAAQTPVGAGIRFQAIPIGEAQALARDLARMIAALPQRVEKLGGGSLSSEALLAGNLAGHATNALDPAF
ncbi:MAG: biotin-dependent carboxyltransferase family protein [Beijerinckiaceae bacterium]